MKFRLTVLFGFALFVAFISLAGYYRSQQNADTSTRKVDTPPIVNVIALNQVTRPDTLDFYGMVHPSASWELSFQASGLLKKPLSLTRPWREGDLIKKDEIVATLKADREKALLAMSQAQITSANAALVVQKKTIQQLAAMVKVAEAAVDDSKTRVDDAKLEIKRLNDLKEVGGSLQRERERAEVQLASSLAGVRQAQAQLAASQANLNSATAQQSVLNAQVLQAEAQHQQNLALLADMTVKAPDDVMISQVLIEPEQMVGPGQPFLSVHTYQSVHVVIGVSERKLRYLKQGLAAKVHVDAVGGKVYPGKIKLIQPAARREDGLFHMEVSVDNTSDLPRLLPGMTARVKVQLGDITGYPIPLEAVIKPEAVTESASTLTQANSGAQLPYVYMLSQKETEKKTQSDSPQTIHGQSVKVPLSKPLIRRGERYFLQQKPQALDLIVVQGQNLIEDGQSVIAYPLNAETANTFKAFNVKKAVQASQETSETKETKETKESSNQMDSTAPEFNRADQ